MDKQQRGQIKQLFYYNDYIDKSYCNFFISAICIGDEPQQAPTTDAPKLIECSITEI